MRGLEISWTRPCPLFPLSVLPKKRKLLFEKNQIVCYNKE